MIVNLNLSKVMNTVVWKDLHVYVCNSVHVVFMYVYVLVHAT